MGGQEEQQQEEQQQEEQQQEEQQREEQQQEETFIIEHQDIARSYVEWVQQFNGFIREQSGTMDRRSLLDFLYTIAYPSIHTADYLHYQGVIHYSITDYSFLTIFLENTDRYAQNVYIGLSQNETYTLEDAIRYANNNAQTYHLTEEELGTPEEYVPRGYTLAAARAELNGELLNIATAQRQVYAELDEETQNTRIRSYFYGLINDYRNKLDTDLNRKIDIITEQIAIPDDREEFIERVPNYIEEFIVNQLGRRNYKCR